MNKRKSDVELNHDNWDQPYEPQEESGEFGKAPDDVMRTRPIIKGKRRLTDSNQDGSTGSASSVFSGFAGFTSAKTANDSKPAFSFLNGLSNSNATPFSNSDKEENSSSIVNSKAVGSGFSSSNSFKTDSDTVANNGSTSALEEGPSPEVPRDGTTTTAPESHLGDTVGETSASDRAGPASSSTTTSQSRSGQFLRNLKALNESLLQWIEIHVKKNPYCDLTPVFKDYGMHMDRLANVDVSNSVSVPQSSSKSSPGDGLPNCANNSDSSHSSSPTNNVASTNTSSSLPQADLQGDGVNRSSSSLASGSVSNSKPALDNQVVPNTSTDLVPVPSAGVIDPGNSTDSKRSPVKASLFGSGSDSGIKPGFFSLGSNAFSTSVASASGSSIMPGAPNFLFGAAGASNQSSGKTSLFGGLSTSGQSQSDSKADGERSAGAKGGGEEDDDEKVEGAEDYEFKQVKEEDAFHSVRCKLFYKKDGAFKDNGIGMLYLKEVGKKIQLVIRADTNIGKILLNVVLKSDIPVQRSGKNNVIIVCVTDPDAVPVVPTTVLIRVKSEEDANELHKQITTSVSRAESGEQDE